ncbi:MAG: tetratricopeptide repeat protein [Turneriella sp.]|nr:tetratricopeptide repeat protein [Turneriella sp.]
MAVLVRKSLWIISVLLTFALNADDRWNKAMALAQKADRLIQQKRFDEGVAAFVKAEEIYPDGGYYATRLGSLYRDREDLATAMTYYERALSQGGNNETYTLREHAIALCRARRFSEADASFNSALRVTTQRQENTDEALYVLGYHAICKRDEGRFAESVALADRGFALKPGTNIFVLNEAKLHSEVWLGHEAMVGGRYQEAVDHYSEAEAVGKRSAAHRDWIEKAAEVANLKKIAGARLAAEQSGQKPEYVHRVQVYYLKRGKFDFIAHNGEHIVAEDEITDFQKKRSEFFMRVLQKYVEAMSGGRLTLEFSFKELDTVLTEVKRDFWEGSEVRTPELDSLPDAIAADFCEAASRADTIWIFWAGTGVAKTANGGASNYPCIPYQLYTPLRGYVSFPAGWSSVDAPLGYMHEFFHDVEAMHKFPVTHGFLPQNRGKFPGWRGNGQMDYFLWQFQNSLPGNEPAENSYTNMNYLQRQPNYLTNDLIRENRNAAAQVSPENRKEARRLAVQASDLYWQKRNHRAALGAAEAALALFPAQRDALLIASHAAHDLKDFQKMQEYTLRLIPLPTEAWVYNRLASVQQWQLKDLAAAIKTYEYMAARFPEYQESFANQGRALMDLDRFDEALAAFDKGRLSTSTVQKPTVAAQSAFWKGFLLGEKRNQPGEALALVEEAIAAGYSDSFVQSYRKKYSGTATVVPKLGAAPQPPKITVPVIPKPRILH